MNSRAHLFIYGDVIGVGYRYWTVGQARKLGLTGWVMNLADGVEAIFEGSKESIDRMLKLCREGPPTGLVKNIDIKREDYKGEFSRFEIKY